MPIQIGERKNMIMQNPKKVFISNLDPGVFEKLKGLNFNVEGGVFEVTGLFNIEVDVTTILYVPGENRTVLFHPDGFTTYSLDNDLFEEIVLR